ncbi:periplasmic hemin-binding protein [Vibrio variabilis]|uniref:Periplasmic hemin-binding protein n=1 Tax=Vibrio variabilis TaxID=990271 RepID=A0ABQ0JH27_9VIBR|nr:periplasmic hemin-binding protein [Vibrio variabilis]
MKQTIKNYFRLASLLLCLFSTAIAEGTEKIVSAGASVTELIYALGAQSQLVGVDVTSVTPKESPLPKVGYHRALSAEG